MGVMVTTHTRGILATSLDYKKYEPIKNVDVVHNQLDGKNEIEVRVNGMIIFKYDANEKGEMMKKELQVTT